MSIRTPLWDANGCAEATIPLTPIATGRFDAGNIGALGMEPTPE
jgi:hypothetical protein